MSLIADLIAAGEEVSGEAFAALHSAQTRHDLAQHFADIVNAIVALNKPAEPTPAPAPVAQVSESPVSVG